MKNPCNSLSSLKHFWVLEWLGRTDVSTARRVIHVGAAPWTSAMVAFTYLKLEIVGSDNLLQKTRRTKCAFPFVLKHVLVIYHYRKCQTGAQSSCQKSFGQQHVVYLKICAADFLIAQCSLIHSPGQESIRHVLLSKW